MFFVVFIDLKRYKSFAYIPKEMGSKSCSSSWKFLWWVRL